MVYDPFGSLQELPSTRSICLLYLTYSTTDHGDYRTHNTQEMSARACINIILYVSVKCREHFTSLFPDEVVRVLPLFSHLLSPSSPSPNTMATLLHFPPFLQLLVPRMFVL